MASLQLGHQEPNTTIPRALPANAGNLIDKAMDCYKDALLIWEMEFEGASWQDTRKKSREASKERKTEDVKKTFAYITQ